MLSFRSLLLIAAVLAAGTLSAQADSSSPTLQKIAQNGAIAIGYRESSIPFSYLDANQKPIGFSLGLCDHVIDRIKQQLKLGKLDIHYVAVNSANRIPLVKNGTVDLECGSTAHDLQRAKQVGFSVSTFVSSFRLLSKKSSDIKSLDDLKGKSVAVTQGSNTVAYLAKLNRENHLGITELQAKDHAESFLMVQTGRAAAFFEDDILLAGVRANARDPQDFVLSEKGYSNNPYGLMFRKDDPGFKQLVDNVLVGLMHDGEFTKLYKKWFESPIPPHNINLEFPMSAQMRDLVEHPTDKVTH